MLWGKILCPASISSCGDYSAIDMRWQRSVKPGGISMDFICPKCGHGAFKLMGQTVEVAECLSCGTVTPLGKPASPTEPSGQSEQSELQNRQQ
jgi:hypothetical protein